MMDEIIKLIASNGWGIFLTGVIASIAVGFIKTPLHKVFIKDSLGETEKKKRENIFDTCVFLGTYVIAFIGAFIYTLIINKEVQWELTLEAWLPVWMAQSMTYGVWKKLGLKRTLLLLAKLFVKDTNNDGDITLDEAISQVKSAYKDGKIDMGTLVNGLSENANENLEGVVAEVAVNQEITPEIEATAKAINGEYSDLVEVAKDKIITKDLGNGVEITNNKTITF